MAFAHITTRRLASVHDGDDGRFGGPLNAFCLAARSTTPTGAWPSPQAAAGSGSKMAMMAPSRGPQEAVYLQGKRLGVHDPRPLGAGMASPASFSKREKYCHNGAWPSRPTSRRRLPRSPTSGVRPPGSRTTSWPPFVTPRKCVIYREELLGSVTPLGATIPRLAVRKDGSEIVGRLAQSRTVVAGSIAHVFGFVSMRNASRCRIAVAATARDAPRAPSGARPS